MGRTSKSGHLHGGKDENVSHRVQQCMGSLIMRGHPYTQECTTSNIDDGNYAVLAAGLFTHKLFPAPRNWLLNNHAHKKDALIARYGLIIQDSMRSLQ